MRVWEPLAALGTVVAWNRPGIGASQPPRVAQTSAAIVEQLRALLLALAVPPPYVLVGHSLGGLHVQYFTRNHPDEVSAVVLLDATAPQDVATMAAGASRLQRSAEALLDRLWPPDPHSEVVHAKASAAQVQSSPDFPAIPLAVISGTRPALSWLTPRPQREARALHQQALSRLSPLGTQTLASRSGHFPQISEPALVVKVITNIVHAVSGCAAP
jgi:pimeloyl-ACP methyl ester carboxylesterase